MTIVSGESREPARARGHSPQYATSRWSSGERGERTPRRAREPVPVAGRLYGRRADNGGFRNWASGPSSVWFAQSEPGRAHQRTIRQVVVYLLSNAITFKAEVDAAT